MKYSEAKMQHERDIAKRESARYQASIMYFTHRPNMWNTETQKSFDAGFDRAWEYLKSLEDK